MSKTAPRVSRSAAPPHLAARLRTLQRRIAKWQVPALLVTNPRDIRYLTGFVGDDSWALVPAHGSGLRILTDFRFKEQVQREAPHVRAVIRDKSLGEALVTVMDDLSLPGVGLQADYMTLAQRRMLAERLKDRWLVEVADKMLEQRAVKDAKEVAAIRRALAIQQEAYQRTLRRLKPGQTEAQVAAMLEYEMRAGGADGTSFPSIVAAGANASLPHAIPGGKKLKKNDILLIDWGARWGGYCSDMTRVIALGKMPARIREIYRIVRDAQQAAIAAVAPGKSLKEVDSAARDLIKQAGYGEQFGHGLGHGIGLDIHEQPSLSQRSEGTLREGHVITIEPGIYLPGVGGVRLEDDVLVTATGHRVLSQLPSDLESAMI